MASPGRSLGRDAGFWLRGTGVRALRNPAVARRGCASSPPGQDLHVPVNLVRTQPGHNGLSREPFAATT